VGSRRHGSRDLARSLLCHALGSEVLAERLCREFAWEVVVTLPWVGFCLTRARVTAWIEDREA
jgi:translation elongation factor EF-4